MSAKTKLDPTPVRFDPTDAAAIDELQVATGIPKQELIRRSIRFAVPKFLKNRPSVSKFGNPIGS